MSRFFKMEVVISGHVLRKLDAIKKAAEEEWPFEDWRESANTWTSYAEGDLCGGESDEEFAERLSKAVWRTNGAFCDVQVRAFFLEELPVESYSFGKEDYVRLMKRRNPSKEGSSPPRKRSASKTVKEPKP
jgi:hypothetical protein